MIYDPHSCPYCHHHLGQRKRVNHRPFTCTSCKGLVIRAHRFKTSEVIVPLLLHLAGAVCLSSFLFYLVTTVSWPAVVGVVGLYVLIRVLGNPVRIAWYAARGGYVPANPNGETEYFAVVPPQLGSKLKGLKLSKQEREHKGGLSLSKPAQQGDLETVDPKSS